MTMFPWSQNGETTGAPFAGSPSLAPVACLPSRRPLRLPTCLCSSGTEGTTLPHITHLSSFCHPWSPSSKSRNLYLGGKGGTSLSKSTIPPPRVGGTDQRGRGGRQAANVAKQQEGTTETRGLERDSGGGGRGAEGEGPLGAGSPGCRGLAPLSLRSMMGMMQTQPRSKSLAPTRISAAKEPPPGAAPPLVPQDSGEAGMKK